MIGNYIKLAGTEYRRVARMRAVDGLEYESYIEVADAADKINNSLAPATETLETWHGLQGVSLDIEARNLRRQVFDDQSISIEDAHQYGEWLNVIFTMLKRKQGSLKDD